MSIEKQLQVLGDETRLRMLRVLDEEELQVGELARVLQLPQSTVSRHVKQLVDAKLAAKRTQGTVSWLRRDGGEALWAVIRAQVAYPEDLLRLEAVVAQRQMDSQEFFGRHAEHWDALRQELFGSGYLLPLLSALLPPGVQIADLGCGTGAVLQHLPSGCIGVDREQAMLDAALKRVPGADLRRGVLEALPLTDDEVDLALCVLVLHHVPDLAAVFAEVRRALRPGGRLLVLDMLAHDRTSYRQTMGHRHLGFRPEDLDLGLRRLSWQELPREAEAQGPGLFLAVYAKDPDLGARGG